MRITYDDQVADYVQREHGLHKVFLFGIEEKWLCNFNFHGGALLDVGTGIGRIPMLLRDRFDLIVGGDLSFEMLKKGRERCRPHEHIHFVRFDAGRLPFDTNMFDVITAFGLFEYIDDMKAILSEFGRVCVPGGRIVFTCHKVDSFFLRNSRNISKYSKDEVHEALAGTDFCVQKIVPTMYFNGRLIWRIIRVFQRLGCGRMAVEALIMLNRLLSSGNIFTSMANGYMVVAIRDDKSPSRTMPSQ